MQMPFSAKSDFFKNALTLIGGTSVSQLIPLIAAPILTRLYSPEDYGILGMYKITAFWVCILLYLQC